MKPTKILDALVHTDSLLIAAIAMAFTAFFIANMEASSFYIEEPTSTITSTLALANQANAN